jgi:hypothetical protein
MRLAEKGLDVKCYGGPILGEECVERREGGGFRSTLLLALLVIALSVAFGVGIGNTNIMERMAVVGPLFAELPARTTTGPVIVKGIQNLD